MLDFIRLFLDQGFLKLFSKNIFSSNNATVINTKIKILPV